MKKLKMGLLGVTLSVLISGTASAAGTAYYIKYMDDMYEGYTLPQIDKHVKEAFKNADETLYHNTIDYAYDRMNGVKHDADVYVEKRVSEYYNAKLRKNTAEIDKHADDLLKEIKKHIDEELAKEIGK